MKIGIIILCTNAYFILALRFIKHFVKYYTDNIKEITFYIFSDTDPAKYMPNIKNYKYFNNTHTSWLDATNSRYKSIISLSEEPVDYLFFVDADTDIDKPFKKDRFIGDLVGLEHFSNRHYNPKPFDKNPLSKAYIPDNTPNRQMYYHGSFFGGKKENLMRIGNILLEYQTADKEIPYEPQWNDESYLNKYFHDNPPSKVISDAEYMFIVSDKGGIEGMRNTSLDISNYKDLVLKKPTVPFKLAGGTLTFHQEANRRSIKKTKKRKSK